MVLLFAEDRFIKADSRYRTFIAGPRTNGGHEALQRPRQMGCQESRAATAQLSVLVDAQCLIQPVENLLVEPGPVPRFAVSIRTFSRSEAHEHLGAGERVVKALRPSRNGIPLRPGDERRTANPVHHVRKAISAQIDQVLTQAGEAVNP